MNTAVSIVLLAAVLGVIVFLLSRRENGRRSQYGPSGLSEFRTDLPLDECFDRLDDHPDTDEFLYECRREKDGGFLLHLTLHQPTQQPLDTLYSLRLDPGRQTVVTLIFIREAFGYKEPLFPQEMLDRFMQNMRASSSVGQSWRLITARPYRFHLFQTAIFRCFCFFERLQDRTWVFSGYESRLKNLKQRHKGQ